MVWPYLHIEDYDIQDELLYWYPGDDGLGVTSVTMLVPTNQFTATQNRVFATMMKSIWNDPNYAPEQCVLTYAICKPVGYRRAVCMCWD